MLKILDKYNEVAKYLEEDSIVNEIESMKESINEKKFLLSFIGQFSAGKSKLINNIVGQDILPVHITETTQVVTFIKYSQISYGTIFYKDLTEREVEIEEIKEIWQGKINEDTKNIKYIEVFVNSDLLKAGIIIADTPGVNTIIKEHEDITNNVLKASEEVLYVISKPLIEVDTNFIRQILKMGLKVSCVRTFMDKIKISEESPEETILKDREDINVKFNESNISIYHVSNEENNQWYDNIGEIKKYLLEELSEDVEKNIAISCKNRLQIISNVLIDKLNRRKLFLENLVNGDIEKFKNEKEEIEHTINNLKCKLDNKKKLINEEINRITEIALSDLKEVRDITIRKATREINDISYDKNAQDKIKDIAFKLFDESYVQLQDSYIQPFNEIIVKNNRLIKEEMDLLNIHNILNINDSMCQCIDEVACTIEEDEFEVEEIKRKINSLVKEVEEREKRLMECNVEKHDIQRERAEINEMVRNIEEEIKQFGEYECRYIETESNNVQPSQVLKRIGSALDLATLFIPSKAYVTIAGKIGKYSRVASKAVKAYKNVDTAKDMIYMVNDIVKKSRVSKKATNNVIQSVNAVKGVAEKTGFLDYLTFQYWFEKVGTTFDTPIKMEVDREYEREYNENKAKLTERFNRAKVAELEKLQALGLISNEEQRIKKMQEIDKRKADDLTRELKNKESEMRSNALRQAFDSFKSQYICWFEGKIVDLSNVVQKKCDELIKESINKYSNRVISNINYEITKWNNRNDEILMMFNNSGVDKIKEEIDLCNEYKELLSGEVNV